MRTPSSVRRTKTDDLLVAKSPGMDGCVGALCPGLDRSLMALALRRRHDSVGREGAFLPAAPVPGAIDPSGRMAVLGPLRVFRIAPDRRSAIPDLLAALPGARRARPEPELPGLRRGRPGVPGFRRGLRHPDVPGSRLASGRGGRGRHRVRVRSVGGLAGPACGAGAEPRPRPRGPLAATPGA